MMSASDAWLTTVGNVISAGYASVSRGLVHHEILAEQVIVDMKSPIMAVKERDLGYRFMAAEAAWILSGDARVETIAPYATAIKGFSDDGVFFNGAYGPMIYQQLPYVAQCLIKDPGSRQAVLSIWKPSPYQSKDIPCSLSAQWLYRGNQLHCVFEMRSSDVWLGAPYDWFNFSMLTGFLLLYLRIADPNGPWKEVVPGNLYYRAGSCHLYDKNIVKATEIYQNPSHYTYKPFNIDEFRKPSHLVSHLWRLAERQTAYNHDFALESIQWTRE